METAINNIRQNEDNPRKISKTKMSDLVNSILSFPEMLAYRSLVTDKGGVIIGGNMRHKALMAIAQMTEGETRQRLSTVVRPEDVEARVAYWNNWRKNPSVSVESTEMDDDERTEFIIKDNGDFGEWDKKMVENLYADVFQSYESLNATIASYEPVAAEPATPAVSVPTQDAPLQGDHSGQQFSSEDGGFGERQDGVQPSEPLSASPSTPAESVHTPDSYEQPPATEQVVGRGFYEPPVYCDYMQIDRYKIPVTSQEKERYMNVLDNYCEENGISYGFINHIKNGMGIIK